MILAGQLNRIITIQRATIVRDPEFSSENKEWADLLTNVRAQVVQRRSSAGLSSSNTETPTEDAIFRIRVPRLPAGSDPNVVTDSDRIVYDGHYWDLLPFRDLGGAGLGKRVLVIPAKRSQGVA